MHLSRVYLEAFVLVAFLYIITLFSSHAVLLAPSVPTIQPIQPLTGLNSLAALRIPIDVHHPKSISSFNEQHNGHGL
jgi:hypothetical protein